MKTYILQFTYKDGNGWATVNAHSPNQAEQVFKAQTKFESPKILNITELRYFGEEMQLVYEGSVSTLNENLYSLAVENGFEGTIDDFINSQKGPKGDKGDKGDTGGDGKNGTNGKSAYEVAVDNGFYGTEEDWLESLKGTDGHNGQDGTDGINGIDGTDGTDGVSIQSVEQTTTSHVSEGENIITVTLSNGNTSTFSVFNGEKGADGSGGGGVEQIQSDWTQSDNTKKDYIKNKPTLATVATSGSYNDLSNKPTIPDAQVQANWNESNSSSKAYIQNKPSLATVATSGSYNDLSNKPTIPDVSGKADKTFKVTITSATSNNVTTYSSDKTVAQILEAYQAGRQVIAVHNNEEYGIYTLTSVTNIGALFESTLASANQMVSFNITDNDVIFTVSELQSELTFDNTPTQNSNNPVKSGGVYSALADKCKKRTVVTTGSALTADTYLELGTTDTVAPTLPATYTDADEFIFSFTCDTSACTVTLPTGVELADNCDNFSEIAAGVFFQVSIMDDVAAYLCVTPTT